MKKLSKKAEIPFWMVMLIWALIGLFVLFTIIAGFNPNLKEFLFTLGGLL
tara:strand:+ start:4937 stop:5086 length:150 start_codon:yes stop_codon:yes gene_type:complete